MLENWFPTIKIYAYTDYKQDLWTASGKSIDNIVKVWNLETDKHKSTDFFLCNETLKPNLESQNQIKKEKDRTFG